jgi:hypothetical protein
MRSPRLKQKLIGNTPRSIQSIKRGATVRRLDLADPADASCVSQPDHVDVDPIRDHSTMGAILLAAVAYLLYRLRFVLVTLAVAAMLA